MMDVMIYESGNGGEISLRNGDIETTDALFNQFYLAHFGGNIEAKTIGNEPEGQERFDWWGNSFLDGDSQMNSGLEKALNENTINSAGRSNIEREAKKDIEYLSELGDLTISVSGGGNKLNVSEKIKQIVNDLIWDATKQELIQEITI